MALIYKAQLSPSKIELLSAWVPAQPWLGGVDASTLDAVGAYRFDDPAGEVGIETHLLRAADGQILQVPVTYRGAPTPGIKSSLLGTSQHSVLGKRWVYDGCGDSVCVQALVTAILTGGTQAELEVMTDAGPERRQATTQVSGSGAPHAAVPRIGPVTNSHQAATTVMTARDVEVTVLRIIDAASVVPAPGDAGTLTGIWPGHDAPALLAFTRSARSLTKPLQV